MRNFTRTACVVLLSQGLLVVFAYAQAQDNRGFAGTAPGSASGGRIALVIGNSAYTGIPPLANPINDATDMASALEKCGFAVTLKTDSDLRTMEESVDSFAREIRGADAAVFFYAGHGVEVEGQNYLIPIGANIGVEQDVRYECMNMGRVLARVEDAEPKVSVLILDACRNNSLPKKDRTVAGGLAPMNASLGTIIAYSTSPGSVAKDGVGQRNSPYTAGLLKHLNTPGLSARDMFDAVRLDVVNQTDHGQEPWESTKMIGRFYFVPSDNEIAPTPEAEITAMLAKWARDVSNKNLDGLMDAYADQVTPYFIHATMSATEIRADKEKSLRPYDTFEITIKNLDIALKDSNRAVAEFDKSWEAHGPNTRFAGAERQRLTLRRLNGQWKIVSEEELEIYWVEK